MRKERVVLRHVTDSPLARAERCQFDVIENDAAAIGRADAGDDLEQRRLSCAGRTEDAESVCGDVDGCGEGEVGKCERHLIEHESHARAFRSSSSLAKIAPKAMTTETMRSDIAARSSPSCTSM